MPKRTNRKQQIIEMLRSLLAPQGCIVTPSKFLVDTQLGIPREVDVVAEMQSEGKVVTHSFEVVGHKRPMDLMWVDGMLRKHQTLATDRLFLVSWSGFSKDAVRRVRLSPGVVAVTVGNVDGALSLYADQVNLTLRRARMQVRLPDGMISTVMGAQDTGLHAHDGSLRGTLWQLGTWMLQRPTLGRVLTERAHNDPRREEMRWFELNVPLASTELERLFLRHDAASELHELVELNLQGEFVFSQEEVRLSLHRFTDQVFGHGVPTLGGRSHLLVATVDQDLSVTAVRVEQEKNPESTE